MRFQYAPLKSKPTMFQPTNPCPICGAEITLAEIEPHLCTPNLKFTAIYAAEWTHQILGCDWASQTVYLKRLQGMVIQSRHGDRGGYTFSKFFALSPN